MIDNKASLFQKHIYVNYSYDVFIKFDGWLKYYVFCRQKSEQSVKTMKLFYGVIES